MRNTCKRLAASGWITTHRATRRTLITEDGGTRSLWHRSITMRTMTWERRRGRCIQLYCRSLLRVGHSSVLISWVLFHRRCRWELCPRRRLTSRRKILYPYGRGGQPHLSSLTLGNAPARWSSEHKHFPGFCRICSQGNMQRGAPRGGVAINALELFLKELDCSLKRFLCPPSSRLEEANTCATSSFCYSDVSLCPNCWDFGSWVQDQYIGRGNTSARILLQMAGKI